jgi:hypothetical protein
VWESNLLFTDTSSTYEEALGLSWKDLASFGTRIAALLLPRFLIPLFSQVKPFQRLCCLLFASRRASPECRCSLSCGCPRGGEVPAGPSNPLAEREAMSSKNAETYAIQHAQFRLRSLPESDDFHESCQANADCPSADSQKSILNQLSSFSLGAAEESWPDPDP